MRKNNSADKFHVPCSVKPKTRRDLQSIKYEEGHPNSWDWAEVTQQKWWEWRVLSRPSVAASQKVLAKKTLTKGEGSGGSTNALSFIYIYGWKQRWTRQETKALPYLLWFRETDEAGLHKESHPGATFAKHSLPLWVVKTEGLTDHTSQAFIQGPTTNFRSKKSQLIKKLIN